jgi:hypothetical protein
MDLVYFVGRFHVLVLHLPIGIIVGLFALEWLARKDEYRYLRAASPFLWAATAISAIVTVVLGYMHFAEGGFVGAAAFQHRNFGTALAVIASVVALLRVSKAAESYQKLFFPAALLMLALAAITGHYGGNLTHGSTYLVEYAPQPLRSLAGLPPRRSVTSVAEADPFADVVGPMLEERCASCHNNDKQESGLDVTSYELLMRGAESGRVVVPGNPGLSELLRRITQDPSDEEFMPAEGKTPLSTEQVRIVEWWIGAGAPRGTTFSTLTLPPEIEALVAAELGLSGT